MDIWEFQAIRTLLRLEGHGRLANHDLCLPRAGPRDMNIAEGAGRVQRS